MSHISFSALKNWNQCPYYYKLTYIDKIRKFVGKYLFIEVPGIVQSMASIQNAHNYYFTPNTLNSMLTKSGFKRIAMEWNQKTDFLFAVYEKCEASKMASYHQQEEVDKILRIYNLDNFRQKYIELSRSDVSSFFANSARRSVNCVACGFSESRPEFKKDGFEYVSCLKCGTLYQSPRPSIEDFNKFYRDSKSSNYWAEVFFPVISEIRREKIFRARVDSIASIFKELNFKVGNLIDVGAGYGIFLEEWKSRFPKVNALAVEPSNSLSEECRRKGFDVLECVLEEVYSHKGFADLVTCFEILEYNHDPISFVKALAKLARPGGYVFVSTLCIDGFDLQSLWQKSTQISPPHQINFISVEGFKNLFSLAGLHSVKIMTPGKLDVDFVRNAKCFDDSEGVARFMNKILMDDNLSNSFQSFLVENNLSSNAWVWGKVPIP